MRRWGIVISLVYAVIVVALLVPFALFIAGDETPWTASFYRELAEGYRDWVVLIPVAAVIAGQAVLLFLSVDISHQRLKPKAHIATTCVTAALLFGMLCIGAIFCIDAAFNADSNNRFMDWLLGTRGSVLLFWMFLWAFWALVFYLFYRNSSNATSQIVKWLLRGSVLELLIAVPSHVIVRRRHECCAPIFTGLGITAGIAIMLLSFGPSVFFLYKKRLNVRATRKSD
jgi:hypothetical protein